MENTSSTSSEIKTWNLDEENKKGPYTYKIKFERDGTNRLQVWRDSAQLFYSTADFLSFDVIVLDGYEFKPFRILWEYDIHLEII